MTTGQDHASARQASQVLSAVNPVQWAAMVGDAWARARVATEGSVTTCQARVGVEEGGQDQTAPDHVLRESLVQIVFKTVIVTMEARVTLLMECANVSLDTRGTGADHEKYLTEYSSELFAGVQSCVLKDISERIVSRRAGVTARTISVTPAWAACVNQAIMATTAQSHSGSVTRAR